MEDMAPDLEPDQIEIRRHISHLTRRWHELGEPALLEVVFLSADDKAQVKGVYHFSPDEAGLDAAADHVAKMNVHGLNAYCVVNPVSATNRPPVNKRASHDHILASFFHWADADDAQAAENIKEFVGPKHTFHVITGRHPSPRPHVYWELEDPTRNLEAWERTQRAIAATLKTDPSVVDPPRIMRLAGTINWPKPKKRAKGYVAELTRLKIYDEDGREPVSSERMARAFVSRANTRSDGFQFDTGEGRSAEDYADILRRARTDGEKHTGVRDLAASLAGMGVSRSMAEAIIRDACPVWDDNVEALISSAYEKFWRTGNEDAARATVPDKAPFKSWDILDPLAHPRRDFIYGKHYVRKFASVTVAAGGLGKSTLVLAECIAIATGRGILGITPKQRERVVYFNAEDPLEEIERRVLALVQHHDIPQEELVGWLYLASGRETELILSTGEDGDIVEPVFELIEKFAAEIQPGVFAFDPLANMTDSPETNDVFRRLGKRLSRLADALNCSIEIVHHTRKLNGKEAEIEDSRGGGALIGAVRSGRVLNPMTAEDAAKAGLDTHIDHFRIEAAGKNNLARAAERATWLRRVDVELANGEHVAAVEPWEWPDAFDGVTPDDARKVQIAIDALEEPPRANVQSATWAGITVARVLGMDADDKADRSRINSMLKAWIKTDVLSVVEVRDTRNGRDVKAIVAGRNIPNAHGAA